ncbi:P1 family peptidase [Candidatus Dojkabacteria bacterium]|nr:P1 family peptidase [Candidatus Dojkabacteria bacterium]
MDSNKNFQNNSLTQLSGVRVGNVQDGNMQYGLTLVVFPKPLNVACVSKGGASVTYNTTNLSLDKNYYLRHAIYIADGGHDGLNFSSYINEGLSKLKIGFENNSVYKPSIVGAVISSLGIHSTKLDYKLGLKVVENISSKPVQSGNIGAGYGASVGKFSWLDDKTSLAMKGGLGHASEKIGKDGIVTAMSVVNALGNVVNEKGEIIAGNRHNNSDFKFRTFKGFSDYYTCNTTISIVGTNLKLDFLQQDLTRIAELVHIGQARAIDPINTSFDGDTVFVFSTQEVDFPFSDEGKSIENGEWWKFKVDILAQSAISAVRESIYDAIRNASTIDSDLTFNKKILSLTDYN